jgi:hypothetical protein
LCCDECIFDGAHASFQRFPMGVVKASTSGGKRPDFVTARTESEHEECGLSRRALGFVNWFRLRDAPRSESSGRHEKQLQHPD